MSLHLSVKCSLFPLLDNLLPLFQDEEESEHRSAKCALDIAGIDDIGAQPAA